MNERPIVVMCAIPQEAAAVRLDLEAAVETEVAGRRVTEGVLAGRSVVVAEAGIGKVNAAVVTTQLADRYQPRAIVFTGVAGGLDPGLHVGDVVIGSLTIQHDAGVIENERLEVHQAGHVPFFNPADRLGFRPSASLLASARSAAQDVLLNPVIDPKRRPRVVVGTIVTGDQFVNCEATRDRLRREFEGAAVEMEGAAVAQAAEVLHIDCLVVRSVSDLAGAGSTLDFARFLDRVAANAARLVVAIIARWNSR